MGVAQGQDAKTEANSVAAIEGRFVEGQKALERDALRQLAKLAESQKPEAADATYEALLSFALSRHLDHEAEPMAAKARKAPGASPRVVSLALLVEMLSEARRGEFDRSLASLVAAVHAADDAKEKASRAGTALPVSSQLSLLDVYDQLLVRAGRFDVARKALETIRDQASGSTIKDYATSRLARLALVGKPAPAVSGKDLDGKDVQLAAGKPTLVVFLASWCRPCADEVSWIDKTYGKHKAAGFRVVGVDLDAQQEGGMESSAVTPTVRRFVVDHNVRWPVVIDAPGSKSIASAYGVTELPANFLVGPRRDDHPPGPGCRHPGTGSGRLVGGETLNGRRPNQETQRPAAATCGVAARPRVSYRATR